MKVLIVDDEESIRKQIMSYLSELALETLVAVDGRLVLEIAKEERPQLIVMDWNMPDVSGLDAVKQLKANPQCNTIPIIMMSGIMTGIDHLEEALEFGAIDFLRKPLIKREFIARIKACLKMREQTEMLFDMIRFEKEKIEELLASHDRELASKAMFKHQRDEMLERLLSQCQRLDRITQQVYATDIKQIEQELNRQLNLQKSWTEFKIQFDKVHPRFFEQLIKINHAITLHDCKVAALIRMGLSNQEIAEFTNVAKVSIRKTLNRLKKKLNISAEEGLKEFLFQIK